MYFSAFQLQIMATISSKVVFFCNYQSKLFVLFVWINLYKIICLRYVGLEHTKDAIDIYGLWMVILFNLKIVDLDQNFQEIFAQATSVSG